MIIVMLIFSLNLYFEWQKEQDRIEQLRFVGTWEAELEDYYSSSSRSLWTFYENQSLKVYNDYLRLSNPKIGFSADEYSNNLIVSYVENANNNFVQWGKFRIENGKLCISTESSSLYLYPQCYKYNFLNESEKIELESEHHRYYTSSITLIKTLEKTYYPAESKQVNWSDMNITTTGSENVRWDWIKLTRSNKNYEGETAPLEWGEIRAGDVINIGDYDSTITLKIRHLPTGTVYGPWNFLQIIDNTEIEKNDLEYWEKTFGGGQNDWGWEVQQTNDNGFIIAGYTESYGNGMSDVWLIKTDDEGNKEWDKTYGGTKSDEAKSVQQTKDGGYIIAGDSFIIGKSSDIWLIKTDYKGNKEWDKTYGETSHEEGYHVQQTKDDGYIVIGHKMRRYENGTSGVILLKTNKDGIKEWEKIYGSEINDVGYFVQQTNDGGYILTGRKDMDKREQYTDYHMWIIKTDSKGNLEWEKILGGKMNVDEGKCIHQTSDGGYICSGNTNSFGPRSYDAWLIKLDNCGNIEWNKTYGGLYYDVAHHIEETSDGGFIFTGGTSLNNFLNWDTWIVKTDSYGNIEWKKTFTGVERDICWSVQQTNDEGYVLVGYTESKGNGNQDIWLIKVNIN